MKILITLLSFFMLANCGMARYIDTDAIKSDITQLRLDELHQIDAKIHEADIIVEDRINCVTNGDCND